MSEPKTDFARRMMEGKTSEALDTERQFGSQAFSLRIKYKDGRRVEGFSWAHYAGYEWQDDDAKETLTLLFGARVVIVEGHGLQGLLREIDEGKRRTLTESDGPSAMLALADDNTPQPVITGIKTFPDIEEILKEIKGDGPEHGFAGKVRGR